MILFGAINIVAFAPLDSPEKPLDSDQKKQYSCISIVILVGLVAAAVLANLLNLHGLESVAFCCISTGEFHFPNELAAEIAVQTVKEFLVQDTSVRKVIFNVFKNRDYEIYKRLLR